MPVPTGQRPVDMADQSSDELRRQGAVAARAPRRSALIRVARCRGLTGTGVLPGVVRSSVGAIAICGDVRRHLAGSSGARS
jgi:hypothetical protein